MRDLWFDGNDANIAAGVLGDFAQYVGGVYSTREALSASALYPRYFDGSGRHPGVVTFGIIQR